MAHYYTMCALAPTGPPSDLKVSLINGSLHIGWNRTSNTKGYVVIYRNSTHNLTQPEYNNTATMTSLNINSTYHLSVYGYYHLTSLESDIVTIYFGGRYN